MAWKTEVASLAGTVERPSRYDVACADAVGATTGGAERGDLVRDERCVGRGVGAAISHPKHDRSKVRSRVPREDNMCSTSWGSGEETVGAAVSSGAGVAGDGDVGNETAGTSEGSTVGSAVEVDAVGTSVGSTVGEDSVGASVGSTVDDDSVGASVGSTVEDAVGAAGGSTVEDDAVRDDGASGGAEGLAST